MLKFKLFTSSQFAIRSRTPVPGGCCPGALPEESAVSADRLRRARSVAPPTRHAFKWVPSLAHSRHQITEGRWGRCPWSWIGRGRSRGEAHLAVVVRAVERGAARVGGEESRGR